MRTKCSLLQCRTDHVTPSHHVLKRSKVIWLQRPSGDPVCRYPPARGHHTGFISRRFPSHMRAAGVRPEFDI